MRSPRLPRSLVFLGLVGAAVVVAAAILALQGSPTIQEDAARLLAERSDAVAARLARGARCAANRGADALRAEAADVVRHDLVAPELARELMVRTTRLARQITCPPPPPALPPVELRAAPAPDAKAGKGEDEHDRDEQGRGKRRGHGDGKGRQG